MDILSKLTGKLKIDRKALAEFLNTTPEALAAFEEAYQAKSLEDGISDNLFKVNSRQAAEMIRETEKKHDMTELEERIVKELLAATPSIYTFDGKEGKTRVVPYMLPGKHQMVDRQELKDLPENMRPLLTGQYAKMDIADNGELTLDLIRKSMTDPDPRVRKQAYNMFRQGLDILDVNAIRYAVIDRNVNTMGYWLPRMAPAVVEGGFFKIPKTTIVKLPITLLQMTRMDYPGLGQTNYNIINRYCTEAFGLKPNGDYFIKTGTYASKFDFRNARVNSPEEIAELGQYLLYIHWQALCMAHYDLSGKGQPCIYGVSTTNEWVVREFIEDVEDNPYIYHGLSLRTEYRLFVDFDRKQVLGIHPYWEEKAMVRHFESVDDIDAKHDLITYTMAEPKMTARYEKNKDKVVQKMEEILDRIDLSGQWSVDIMQNGSDFYLIDMATAQNSAFYTETVPAELRAELKEDWRPRIG